MSDISVLKIATRKSPLAVWQAEHVAARLQSLHPQLEIELVKMTTKGDKILDAPLAKIGGKGLFVKELEQGLLNGDADIAVHSMKDVPMAFPDGLELGAILARANPLDAFVSNKYNTLADLPDGATVGTSSLRRQLQLLRIRPDLQIKSLRGNVNTRLSKLDAGEFDAIILAAAGLERLEFSDRIASLLDASECIPSVGQGALGIECRTGDKRVHALIAPLICPSTTYSVNAERAYNETLNGGCQVPIAGHATLNDDQLTLTGMVGQPSGEQVVYGEVKGSLHDAKALGIALAEDLLMRGAREILTEFGLNPN